MQFVPHIFKDSLSHHSV